MILRDDASPPVLVDECHTLDAMRRPNVTPAEFPLRGADVRADAGGYRLYHTARVMRWAAQRPRPAEQETRERLPRINSRRWRQKLGV